MYSVQLLIISPEEMEKILKTAKHDGYIFIFSVNDESSFKQLEKPYEIVNNYYTSKNSYNFPRILVGNKSDSNKKRQVNEMNIM